MKVSQLSYSATMSPMTNISLGQLSLLRIPFLSIHTRKGVKKKQKKKQNTVFLRDVTVLHDLQNMGFLLLGILVCQN